jgi:DNA-binding NarL/FixJ family response regulator
MIQQDKIRVYIVDDHPLVHRGLRSVFEDYSQIEVAGGAFTSIEALRDISALRPDVALVDWRLVGEDGSHLCLQLKALDRPPRVLVLTTFSDESSILAAVGAGADGFVVKTSQDHVLVAAITTVAAGGTVWPASATLSFRELLQHDSHGGKSPLDLLSPQEQRVVASIAKGKTNKEIATEFGVSEKTVRNQVSSLMQKLKVDRRAQAAAVYVKYQL